MRIQLTGVQSSNAFYSAADEQLIADSFNVWSVHFAQRKKRGTANSGARTTQDRHALRFHPIFIRNYEAQYLKGLDSEFFWALKMPLSKRLYRLIDLQRAGGLSWRTDLFAVRDQIPLDYSYASQIKRALRKAHAELEEKGFLSGSSTERVRTTPRACSTASPTPSLAGRGFVQQFELQADVCGERPFSASHQDGRHEQVASVDQPGLESLGGEVGTAHADVASRLPFHPPDRFGVEVSLDPGPCARYP